MEKTNILFISHAGNSGGAEKCLLDLVCYLDRDKYNLHVNIPYKGPLSEELSRADINCLLSFTDNWIPERSRWGVRHAYHFLKTLRARIWAIEKKIQRLHIDLVYSNSITCIDGAIAAYRMGVPHIWHIHENLRGNRSLRPYFPEPVIRYIINKLSARFIAVSGTVAKVVSGRHADRNVAIINNGVDLDKFAAGRNNSLHSELGIDHGTCVIASIGAVIPAKGIEVFIQSAEIVAGRYTDKSRLAFVIAGDGDPDYIEQIRQQIRNSTCESSFYLLGHRDDVPELMNSIDILVLASESEGFSRVVLEAMASGNPVVSTRCGGPEELIIEGQTGLFVPVGDIWRLSEKLKYLIDNPKHARLLGANGRKRAVENFGLDQYVHSVELVIHNAITGK